MPAKYGVARQRHLTDNAALAALQCLDIGDAAVDVDRRRREGQHLRDTARTPSQHQAEQARLRISAVRRLDETPPLGSVEIFSTAGRPVEAHPGVGMRPHRRLA